MSDDVAEQGAPEDEELRALLEEEMRRLRVEDMLLQSAVSLINLGARRLGSSPDTEAERDLAQVEAAIDGVRGLMGVIERTTPAQAPPLRDALSQLQLAFVRSGGTRSAPADGAAGPGEEGAAPSQDDAAGPARRSGRLWVPGDQ